MGICLYLSLLFPFINEKRVQFLDEFSNVVFDRQLVSGVGRFDFLDEFLTFEVRIVDVDICYINHLRNPFRLYLNQRSNRRIQIQALCQIKA